MENNYNSKNQVSRRRFISLTAAAATFALVPAFGIEGKQKKAKAKKPNSKFGGVQIGAITYSWRDKPASAEETLNYCLASGISSIELMSNTAEMFAGIPQVTLARPARDASEEQRAAFQKAMRENAEVQKTWRKTAPMTKFEELRKMYNKAGVNIHIAKFSPENWSDEEIDYSFRAAKAMGARGVSTEIGDKAATVLAPFAQKYGMQVILHQHMQPGQAGWTFEKFLDMSPANMLNFDAGHYFGATGLHPNGIIEKLHTRISSIHIKDKTGPKATPPNTNMEFGKGQTPIADILNLLKTNKWPINVDIELEYTIPAGSDSVAEVKKCVDYCRNILA